MLLLQRQTLHQRFDKFTQDKAKYKLKTSDIMQNCTNKIIQKAKDNLSVNEATFSSGQESTYFVWKKQKNS